MKADWFKGLRFVACNQARHNITLVASGNNIRPIEDTFSLKLLTEGALEFRRICEQTDKETKEQ